MSAYRSKIACSVFCSLQSHCKPLCRGDQNLLVPEAACQMMSPPYLMPGPSSPTLQCLSSAFYSFPFYFLFFSVLLFLFQSRKEKDEQWQTEMGDYHQSATSGDHFSCPHGRATLPLCSLIQSKLNPTVQIPLECLILLLHFHLNIVCDVLYFVSSVARMLYYFVELFLISWSL